MSVSRIVITERLAICVVSIAIYRTFTSTDALLHTIHTNGPVRPDEGNCEIVQRGSKACATPFSRPYLVGLWSLAVLDKFQRPSLIH